VEVHCDEGLATRIGPESCASAREGRGEALTGGLAGWVLSREKTIPGADPVSPRGRRDDRPREREWPVGPARSQTPCMHTSSLRGNREISRLTTGPKGLLARIGKVKAVADDARTGEVGQARSTREVPEQSPGDRAAEGMEGRCLVKGIAEPERTSRTPSRQDVSNAPARRCRGTAWVTHTPNAATSSPETRARCGKSARRDLCGGRRVIAVPTATVSQ
jgi:hypothetical protein